VKSSFLKTGVALVVLMSVSAPAFAFELKPYQPTSYSFSQTSAVMATKTTQVIQTGTSELYAAPAGNVQMAALTDVGPDGGPDVGPESGSSPDVVCCPKSGAASDGYMALPEEIRRTASPGQCFAKLLVAPKVETYMDRVMIQAERTETRTLPAVTQVVEKQVVVAPERIEYRTIPAVTRMVEENDMVTPESYREEVIPAKYETRRDHVMVKPEQQIWVVSQGIKTGAALVTPIEHEPVPYRADGTLTWPGKTPVSVAVSQDTVDYLQDGSAQPVYCLKLIPAEYQDVEKRVEVAPEQTRRIVIPATYKKVKRVVVDSPEQTQEVVIPAKYETRKVTEVVTPERTETYTLPAVFEDRKMSRVTESAQPVWREVLCERNATPETVSRIQKALIARGYDVGSVDGRLGTKTVRAMQAFEADNGLPQGQMSLEAVHLLGIDIK